MHCAYLNSRAVFEPLGELDRGAPLDELPPHPAATKPTVATASASGAARRAREGDVDVPRLARARIACIGFMWTVSFQSFDLSRLAVVGDGW
jgi:hypothetical protein